MRALQGTPTPEADTSLSNITNGSTALVRSPQSFDAISSQIGSLTTIATNLQREMAALSRRSKDNATDLISLKEATSSRDEDIRKSLRDLVSNLSLKLPESETDRTPRGHFARSPGSYLLDDKAHGSPGLPKSISLPRIPSPSSFAASIEREIASSPNPYSVDGAAAIALLEKILREMSTKDGQERLMHSISELASQPAQRGLDSHLTKQLEEITKMLKESTQSRALVRAGGGGTGGKPHLELDFDHSGPLPLARASRNITPHSHPNQQLPASNESPKPYSSPRAADFVSDDILKLLKRMKDSITEGGGMSAEIKALVRELRGEVLGMGREIGRKLDQAESTQKASARGDAQGPGREEIAKIVEDGLSQLKEHMDHITKEHRRQSSASVVSRSTVDSQEIYNVVKNALRELPPPEPTVQGSGIEREEILEAVREAWETYKPEIELQNFGLERDEILECLKEGLQDYKAQDAPKESPGATFDEILDAVRMGLQDFKPPPPVETESSVTREEIITTVRECLESFEFPTPPFPREKESDITREDVLDAVKEGLSTHGPVAKELEFNREDLFDAVRAGLEGAKTPMAGVGEQVLEKMEYLIEGMRGEFQQYSAANGRDTEQVLDAMKDGLEVLRASVETYVDRAADVTGKDEIIETVRNGLENLRIDLEGSIANFPRSTGPAANADLLDAMEKEFEHLRSTISSTMSRHETSSAVGGEVLDAIRDGFDEIRARKSVNSSEADAETIGAVRDELQHLRETLATTLTRGGASFDREEIMDAVRESLNKTQLGIAKNEGRPESVLSNTSELLDAFSDGLDGLKTDVERIVNKPIDMTVNYEILDTLKEGLASVRADLDRLQTQQVSQERSSTSRGGEVVVATDEERSRGLSRPDIENLEVMITQLSIKVEALDNMSPPPASTQPAQAAGEAGRSTDLNRLETMLKELQDSVSAIADREVLQSENAVSKEDTDAIETLLRNTKAAVDDIVLPEPDGMAKVEHFAPIEDLVKDTRNAVDDLTVRLESEGASKQDIGAVEKAVKELQAGIEELREKTADESVKKSDVEALEVLCMDTKTAVTELIPEGEALPTKGDLSGLQGLVKEFYEKVDADAELTAQAFESRKIEHGGLADKIEDVKAFLEDVRTEIKSKIEGSGQGIEGLAVSLATIGETLTTVDMSASFKELKEAVDQQFERSHESHDLAKADMERHREIILDKHDEHKAAMIEELTSKVDARFDELMTKYDDAQLAASEQASAFEARGSEQAETISSTKAVAEDLRLLVDTLGSSLTESCRTMSDDSRTVFTKVEELGGRVDSAVDQITAEGKTDHQLTRAELSKTLVAVESLQAHSTEFNPKLMNAVNDVLNLLGQHFEHAQRSTEEIKTSVNAIPDHIPLAALPAPMPSATIEREVVQAEKYDDTQLHAKLDKLVGHAEETDKAAAQDEILREIKSQVATTATNLDTFAKSQLALTADIQEGKVREAEEAAIALEKRTAQKEAVEAEIVSLSEQKNGLSASVEELKRENQEMVNQKSRLQADLSSLETALQIRREEMQLMEDRAENLERRIIDRVLDHSRSLLPIKPAASLKAMDLKRVPSAASSSNATVTSVHASPTQRSAPSAHSSKSGSALGMALKRRQPAPSSGAPKGTRRILSLSTMGANKGASDRSLTLSNPAAAAARGNSAFGSGLKRSHSVKSNFPSRKSSWGGTKQIGMYGDDGEEEDKENSILQEEEEEEGSEIGTERGTSYTGIYTGTDLGTESCASESVADDDPRFSYEASTIGTVGARTAEDDEEGSGLEEEDDEQGEGGRDLQLYTGDSVQTKRENQEHGDQGAGSEMVVYGLPSDSGLGSELATAALEGKEFFEQ